MPTKHSMRKAYRKLRDSLTPAQISKNSQEIISNLMAFSRFKTAGAVLCYMSFGSEVDTKPLIHRMLKDSRTVLLPVTDPKTTTMIASQIKDFSELEKSHYGILEPKREFLRPVAPQSIDIILIPGLVFDKRGYRIGYGKGYYDKYLPLCTNAIKIGLAYSFQVTDKIAFEPHDLPADYIVTEKGVTDCG